MPRCLSQQTARLPIALEIDASNQVTIVQDGQRVVAEFSFGLRRVDFDSVVKAKYALDSVAALTDWVEGAQDGGSCSGCLSV